MKTNLRHSKQKKQSPSNLTYKEIYLLSVDIYTFDIDITYTYNK